MVATDLFYGSHKVATYLFWVAMVAAYLFWVAQSRKVSVLGRKESLKHFGRTKSQHAHFESQWKQHTLFGSRKVATYLVWVAQSRIKFLRSIKVAIFPF